jgi:hypothetical protein
LTRVVRIGDIQAIRPLLQSEIIKKLTSLDEAELGDELRQAVRHEVTDEHVGNPKL